MKNSLGLAQIPLMIMLLLMAIAVPVATKLVEENADSRNFAYDRNAKSYDECLKTGGPKACRAAFPAPVVVVNPVDKVGKDLPANGVCTADSQCSGQCPYCSKGKCISGCYGVPTFGAGGGSSAGSGGSAGGTALDNKPTTVIKPTTIPIFKGQCSVPDAISCSGSTHLMCVCESGVCFWGVTSKVGVCPSLSGTEEYYKRLSQSVVPTVSKLKQGVNWNEYEQCLGRANPNNTPVNEIVNDCNRTYGFIGGVTPSPTMGTAYDSCMAMPGSTKEFCQAEYPLGTAFSSCMYTRGTKTEAQALAECSALYPSSVPTIASSGSSSGGVPIATATKKPSSGGSSSGGSTTGSNDTANCHEQCPGTDGVLYSCTPPEADGSSTASKCETAGRVEGCGGQSYCCPVANGAWTSDMTKCPAVSPTLPAGQSPILNYKVAFGGVNPNSAQCVVDWPLQFIVLGSGESKAYSNIIPPTETVVGNKLQFSGSLVLTGFTKTANIAAFIKGPKHLQVKYGINNQNSAYNKAGGELTLTTDASTSPIYDFTNFPIVPGDVVGTNSDNGPDGWINGVDFAYVKSKSLSHESVDVGGYLKGDLDGNCQVNSNDVNLLKISLQEKQEQLY